MPHRNKDLEVKATTVETTEKHGSQCTHVGAIRKPPSKTLERNGNFQKNEEGFSLWVIPKYLIFVPASSWSGPIFFFVAF